MESFDIQYIPDLYIRDPAVLTMLSVISDRVFIYDSFLLYGMYLAKDEALELPEPFKEAYFDEEKRSIILKNGIKSKHPKINLHPQELEYILWLEKHRALFAEEVLQFSHIPESAPALKLIEYFEVALEKEGLNDKEFRRGEGSYKYIALDNFYWALAAAIRHESPPITDRLVNYPIPGRWDDIVDANVHLNFIKSVYPERFKGDSSLGPIAPYPSVDQIAVQLSSVVAAACIPQLPPLIPYEILKLREDLKSERLAVIDAFRELSTTVVSVLSAGMANEIIEACRFVVDSRVLPQTRQLSRAADARGNSSFRATLRKLIDPARLLLKALDPTEIVSKWDIAGEAAKQLIDYSDAKDKQRELAPPNKTIAMFALDINDAVRQMRPIRYK